MPRRKISLDEAYEVFEQHGLRVEISGINKVEEPLVSPHTLFESTKPVEQAERRVGKKTVRIALHTQQTITSGGNAVYDGNGKLLRIDGQETHSYGPGIVYVPIEIVGDLQYQDRLAIQADADFLSPVFKSYVVMSTRDGKSVAKLASTDANFDMSGFLGKLGETGNAIQLPF